MGECVRECVQSKLGKGKKTDKENDWMRERDWVKKTHGR